MKRARPTFPRGTKTSQILHCRASDFFFILFFLSPLGPYTRLNFCNQHRFFFFQGANAHSNETKLLPVALKISLANCFSPSSPPI